MADSFIKTLDQAVKTLLYNKFGDTYEMDSQTNDMAFCPKEIALRNIAEKRGKTSVDFINFWRTGVFPDWSRQRTPLARHGISMAYTDSAETDATTIKAMPVRLEYDVWFWTRDLNKNMNAAELYIFWQHTNPNCDLYYDDKYLMELDLHFGDVVDESTVDETYGAGALYIQRAPLKMDAWILSGIDEKTILTIYLKIYDDTLEDGSTDVLLYEETIE